MAILCQYVIETAEGGAIDRLFFGISPRLVQILSLFTIETIPNDCVTNTLDRASKLSSFTFLDETIIYNLSI